MKKRERHDVPIKSVVRVYFPLRDCTFTYYNDRFDLLVGDLVYVEGKFAGLPGRVTELSYDFKINLNSYKKIIALAETDVKGKFVFCKNFLVTSQSGTLPYSKVRNCFFPPLDDKDIIVSSSLHKKRSLESLCKSDRGEECEPIFGLSDVIYLSLFNEEGHAVIFHHKFIEVDFQFDGKSVSNLFCSCYDVGDCVHIRAAMCALKDAQKQIKEIFGQSEGFAMILKDELFKIVGDSFDEKAIIFE